MLRSVLIFFYFFSTTSYAVTTVYGLANGSQFKSNKKNATYVLQVGAFKDKDHAISCVKELAKKNSEPLHILNPQKKNGLYAVVTGSITGAEKLRQLSTIYLDKKSVALPPIKKSIATKPKNNPLLEKHVIDDNKHWLYRNSRGSTSCGLSAGSKVLAPSLDSADKPRNVEVKPKLSTEMKKSGKIEVDEHTSREEIEERARQLYFQSAQIDKQIKETTSEEEMLLLKNKQASINQALDSIVNIIINRETTA